MTVQPAHRGARSRGLVNTPRAAGRYRALDRNSNLDPYLAAISDEAPVNRYRDPHCMKGS